MNLLAAANTNQALAKLSWNKHNLIIFANSHFFHINTFLFDLYYFKIQIKIVFLFYYRISIGIVYRMSE